MEMDVRYLLMFTTILMCCQCKRDAEQQPHLSKQIEKFTQVYVDYLQIIASDTARTECREKYLDRVLAKNNMSKELFFSTYDYIKAHPEKASDALSVIQADLQALELKQQKQ
jgi:hypothetical protein